MTDEEKAAAVKAEAELLERLKAKLAPGAEMPKELDNEPDKWIPTGQADGVLFLGERCTVIEMKDGVTIKEVHVESKIKPAFRYLRPTNPGWLAQNPGKKGRGKPTLPPEIMPHELEKQAEELELPIEILFVTGDNKPGMMPAMPQYRRNWRVLRAEEGIWCVFYVG